MKDINNYLLESLKDDWCQQIIRKPFKDGYFEKIGLDVEKLKPYTDWKLNNGKMMSKDQVKEIRNYLYNLINDPKKDVDDYDPKGVIYAMSDEMDNIYMLVR